MSNLLERFKHRQVEAGLDAKSERLICTGLIISERVCRELSQVKDAADLFAADFSGWVARTAISHWRRHKRAPGRDIEHALHLAQRDGSLQGTSSTVVSEFLGGISEEYERADHFNDGYVIEQVALPYLRARALRVVADDARAMLDAGRLDDAEKRWSEYRRVESSLVHGHEVFEDRELHRRAYAAQSHPLFTIPGAVGELLAPQLCRTNFVSTIGVVGRGKSFLLMEIAKYAARARCNVLMCGVGDMSPEDYVLRLSTNLAGKGAHTRDCEAGWVPCMDCAHNQIGDCEAPSRIGRISLPEELRCAVDPDPRDTPKGYKPCSACALKHGFEGASWWRWREEGHPLTESEGWDAMQRFRRRTRGKHFRLMVYPSKALTPNVLEGELERLRDAEQWLPDVIIGDYMDEFGSDAPAAEAFRHREADKWSRTRGIMMRWNCLGIVAEQSDAAGYERDTLGLGNFNEDRRRNDVVTGKLGYNRTPKDEARGIARISWAGKIRNARFARSAQVVIVQDLSCGRPLLGSYWLRREERKKTETNQSA